MEDHQSDRQRRRLARQERFRRLRWVYRQCTSPDRIIFFLSGLAFLIASLRRLRAVLFST
jgi:UDP-N-acetyl-D-mannosaminuronic acid transferase (WecB/TagA/CpsF family)